MFKNVNNYIMLAIIFFALYLTGYFAHAQSYVEKQNAAHINLLENAGFESNLTKWSKVGSLGTFTTTNSTTALLQGKYSANLTFGSSTQSAAACSNYYDPQSLKNSNGEMGFSYRFTSVNPASGTVFVEDASGTVLSKMDLDITLLGEKRDASKLFAFNDKPARLCMLGKGTSAIPWGIILDNTWMGSPRNVVQGSDTATQVGRLRYGKTASCSWTTTSSSFTNLGLNASCATPITWGKAVAPSTKIPAITFKSLPAGKYRIVATGYFGQSGGGLSYGRFSDGTNLTAEVYLGTGSFDSNTNSLEGSFEYSGNQNDVVINLQMRTTTGTVYSSADSADFEIAVYRYPTEALTIFSGMCKDPYECENTFTSAILSTGVVSSSTVAGWVSSGAPSSAVFPLTFKTGLFSAPPICHCTNNGSGSGGDNECNIYNITNSGASAHTSIGNTISAQNFSVSCTRSTDYVQKKVIQGYLSGMLGSPDQKWTDLTGQRSAATTYTNTTNKPIAVVVRYSSSNTTNQSFISVGGVQTVTNSAGYGGTYTYSLSTIVPVGASYSLTLGSPATLTSWAELN